MPDEDELRRMLTGADAPNTLDARRIIARSRRRRLPKQLVAGGAGALVLASVGILALQVTAFQGSTTTMVAGEASDQSAADQSSPELSVIKRAPADKINLCTGTLSEVAGSQYGLQLDVISPASAVANGGPVPVTVRLTNNSSQRVVGSTPASPAITLSQGGIVLWHSNGPTILSLVTVDLAPGESLDYTATFEPVRCAVEDDEAESFRADLPIVPSGQYALSALIDFTADPSMGQQSPELDLVAGPLAPVQIG